MIPKTTLELLYAEIDLLIAHENLLSVKVRKQIFKNRRKRK
jgi:hypothetical protein